MSPLAPHIVAQLTALAVLLPAMGALLGAFTFLLWPTLKAKLEAHDAHTHHEPESPTAPPIAHHAAMALTTGSVLAAAALSWWLFVGLNTGTISPATTHWFTWFSAGSWSVTFGTMLDKLSATMLIVVTTVSACVHVYSWGYMADDVAKRRFFIYLSAFTFAMLMLVTAPNLAQMFLGWEGVGVCSYLLIGFWYHKATANAAAIKAFIVNRVADAAMLIGLFILVQTFGTLTYTEIFTQLENQTPTSLATSSPISLAALLLFIGAMGKSAQFGLHTWLPDAMEGPTPVSALIHAATMVTAGVFLLCRMSPLYEAAPDVLTIVGWVGAITALFAATVGLTQTDIKRVIAYSTCSQLGYMFFAIGVSAYPAAMFHLTTHAFFKALLFLGAGSVIHGMHHEQNIFKYASSGYILRKLLPVTYVLMWLGSLALAGIPPFAGFFSKDLIIESAFAAPGNTGIPLYIIGTLAAALTAIYGFRIIFMSFHNPAKTSEIVHTKTPNTKHQNTKHEHTSTPHESPWTMLAPMLPLALGAVLGGYLLKNMGTLEWWNGAIVIHHAHTALHNAHHIPGWAKALPLVLAVSGIALAFYLFVRHRNIPQRIAQAVPAAYAFSYHKWYIDEAYQVLWVNPTASIAAFFAEWGDKRSIDALLNGGASTVAGFGQWLRQAQTGYVTHYAFAMLLALTLGLGYLLWKVM